jgi:hypothetical protein
MFVLFWFSLIDPGALIASLRPFSFVHLCCCCCCRFSQARILFSLPPSLYSKHYYYIRFVGKEGTCISCYNLLSSHNMRCESAMIHHSLFTWASWFHIQQLEVPQGPSGLPSVGGGNASPVSSNWTVFVQFSPGETCTHYIELVLLRTPPTRVLIPESHPRVWL